MRLWLFAPLLLTACTRSPSPATSAPGDDAAPTAAQAAAEPVAGEPLLDRFLAAHGEDIEGCFKDLPALQRDPASARFEGRGPNAPKTGRLLLAIDASGSMAGKAGGGTKMQAAKAAAESFLGGVPAEVSVGMVAFGHHGSNRDADKAASCAAVETVYPLRRADRTRLREALASFDATGWTPLAAAIEHAGRTLGPADADTVQAIYVVSDGEDTCGGDPAAAARTLHEGGTRAIINIIGFDLAAKDRTQLKAVADAGGGTFVEVSADQAGSLARELSRTSGNIVEFVAARAHTARGTIANSAATAKANIMLSSCVAQGSIRERNAMHAWERASKLSTAERDALHGAVGRRLSDFQSRVSAYTQAANHASDSANASLREAQERIDREAEAAR